MGGQAENKEEIVRQEMKGGLTDGLNCIEIGKSTTIPTVTMTAPKPHGLLVLPFTHALPIPSHLRALMHTYQ